MGQMGSGSSPKRTEQQLGKERWTVGRKERKEGRREGESEREGFLSHVMGT